MSGQPIQPNYLQPGTVVGAYRIEGQIGGGGFGFVYRVRRDGRVYALKIGQSRLSALPPDERASSVERLEREVAALMSLHHPNIVRVHSVERWPDLEGGFPYLVMDHVDGTPLQDWRAAASPSLGRIVAVFEKIAGALAHMHELGIIHRDLKSQNVLVRTDSEPFIVDFGIARPRVAYDVTRAASVGTLTHLAPEYVVFLDSAEARNGSPFDWAPTTDLYALGYVLYEALVGQPPVPRPAGSTAKDEFELLAAIKSSVPRRPAEVDPRIPEALDALVMQLLEKDPRKRPQSASEVARRLREAREAGEGASDPIWIQPFDPPGKKAAGPAAAVGPPRPPADAEEEVQPLEAADGSGDAARALAAGAPTRVKPAPVAARPPTPRVRRAAPEVSLPTLERPPDYDDVGDAPPEAAKVPEGWGRESQILRRAAEGFAAATAPRRRWPAAVAVGVGALLLAVVLLVVSSGRTEQPGPRTLLSDAEAGTGQGAPVYASPPAVADTPDDSAEPDTKPAAARAASKPDDQPIDEAWARRYGRLTVLPDDRLDPPTPGQPEGSTGIVRSRALASEPQVLQRSQRIATAGPAAPAAPKPRGVAFGAHIQARLLTNLDTRTIANGPVEALLHVPYVVRGRVVLPTRTMVYGTASESGGRFTVRFTRMRLPDDTEIAFEGIALARDDGKPGLAASGRIGQEPKKEAGLSSRIAKGTGNILLDTITGGTGQRVVREAGQAALNHEDAQSASGQWALLLDAGVVFDIFVERTF
jgi:predicted Ser/Thr protein kinase